MWSINGGRMKYLLLLPFIVQAVAIAFDEFYFHIKRGLPQWERIGHPIDTLSTLLCFLYVLLFPYSQTALIGYIFLAVLCCLMITKDEWIHKEQCDGQEQWLHALLFLNHSIMLLTLVFLWKNRQFKFFIASQALLIFIFCLYQIVYWNAIDVRRKNK